jgi:hypothetical protein
MHELDENLAPNGVVYILLISDNIPFLRYLDEDYSSLYTWSVILKRSVTGENQFVIRVNRV